MVAEILAVGTELLMGQIANTNAQYLTKRLNDVGVNVYYHSVVGDNPARLKECLLTALNHADVVITTGGLGPTKDDITKETIAEILGMKLVRHEETFQNIRCFFERVNRKMTDNNTKQSDIPEGCTIVPNHNGTAPGCLIEKDGKTIIMFPGPPKEMIPMFEETIYPYFEKKTGQIIDSRMLKVFGLGESEMEMKILDLIESQTNPTIAPYVNLGEVVIRVTARSKNHAEAMEIINPLIEEIKKRLGSNLYALDGETLEQTLAQLLIENNISISTVESCTGGMLASRLVNIPGISKVFENGFITYSNQSKIDVLGVSPDVISTYGAVSIETAKEMVKCLVNKTGTRAGISITGIAGPDGGTPKKPVGSVCIAISLDDEVDAIELKLNGDRDRVRHMACLNALNMLRKKILRT